MPHRSLFGLLLCTVASSGCLPEDARPEPTRILVTSLPSPGSTTTDDGWRVEFERGLLTMSSWRLQEKTHCDIYSEAKYVRIIDLLAPNEQRVAQLFGTGGCEAVFFAPHGFAEFDEFLPSPLLGEGVSETDRAFMQGDAARGEHAVRFHVSGRAARDGVTKKLTWTFVDEATYFCPLPELLTKAELAYAVQLDLGRILEMGNGVREFDAIAAADTSYGNNDGDITLEELDLVTRDDVPEDHYEGKVWATLRDYVATVASPRVAARLGDIDCAAIVVPVDPLVRLDSSL